jgi:hypothetical protein
MSQEPLNIDALLSRGGVMNPSESEQLYRELTAAGLLSLNAGVQQRTLDQPIRVVPLSDNPPLFATGYFTQQKFIWGKTTEEMEHILGIFGKLKRGAFVLQFQAPLKLRDYENRAYSYLPDGREYIQNKSEKVYLPGDGAPQWKLTRAVPAKCLARLKPGQRFNPTSLGGC